MQVYNPGEISDPSTGIVETLISVGTESLIKLTATVTQSDDNIRRYSIEKVCSTTTNEITNATHFISHKIRNSFFAREDAVFRVT